MKLKRIIKTFLISSIVLINISCDQISKDVARNRIDTHEIINVVNDNFIFTKVENSGAAFSIGENFNPTLKIIFLQIFPLLILVFLFRMLIIKNNFSRITTIGFSFIVGGGIGNIYDRILYGSVTDFMYIKLGFFNTAVFNMADVSVFIGTIFIFLNMVLSNKENNLTPN